MSIEQRLEVLEREVKDIQNAARVQTAEHTLQAGANVLDGGTLIVGRVDARRITGDLFTSPSDGHPDTQSTHDSDMQDDLAVEKREMVTGLKIQVGFPKEDIRFVPGFAEKIGEYADFTDGMIRILTCGIVVSGFSQDYACARLELRYEEEFDGGATIDGVLKRAEKFAYDFCQKAGIGVA